MAFKWNINPSGTNIYVDKDGNDSTGDGTSSNPYKSIAKATSVGASGNNIILGNGVWEEQRTLNSKAFKWWGSGGTVINRSLVNFIIYGTEIFNMLWIRGGSAVGVVFYNCMITDWVRVGDFFANGENNIFINAMIGWTSVPSVSFKNNVIINSDMGNPNSSAITAAAPVHNNIFINGNGNMNVNTNCNYNNYTTGAIPVTNGANSLSINNASTGQTVADYFNNYNATSPRLSDFTAKLGSKNIRAGYGNGDIGFSQGFGRSASAAEFSTAGGATLKGLSLVSNQIVLSQVNLYSISATSSSIVLDASASAVNDHFKDLFIRITSGTGVGQIKQITAYNGTTKEATISGTWATIPDSSSTYMISGYLESADIDLGKIVKVKRNWFYGQFGYDLTTVTGRYNQKASASGTDVATSPTFANFGMKYSKENDLNSKPWLSFSPNGKTLFDGTYGDGDDGYTIANGTYILARYVKIKFNVEV